MRRHLILLFLTILCLNTVRAQYDLYVELVKAGTLEEVVTDISEEAKYGTTSMKVIGPINGADMMFIRDMCGVTGFAQPTAGKLKVLDMEDTYVVDSEEPYINLYGVDHTTQFGHFGTCFLYNCRNLEQLVLPSSLVTIDSLALASCSNLQYIEIPPTVTAIGYGAFVGCDNVTYLTIPDGVGDIGTGAFQQMLRLKELTLGDAVETIDNSLFLGDDSLEVINLGRNFHTFNPIVFYTANALRELFVVGENPWYSSVDGVLFSTTCDSLVTFPPALHLTDYIIPDSVRHIAQSAFCNARYLQAVSMPTSMETIDSMAFFNCKALAGVVLNEGLQSIAFGAFGLSPGEEGALTELHIPASVRHIEGGAFLCNASLATLDVDEGNTRYASDEYGKLFNKERTTLCHMPCMADELALPETVVEIGPYACAGAMAMPEMYVPDQVRTIGDGAFAFAAGMQALTLGKGVGKVGDMVIDYCEGLEHLYLFADDIADEQLQPFSFLDESGAVMEQCVLHVMPGKAASYMLKKGFYSEEYDLFFFANLVEMDNPDRVGAPDANTQGVTTWYDTAGRRLKQPLRGVMVERTGGKSLKRFFK